MRETLGYWRFLFRLWRHETADKLRWKIAWMLPRRIALLAFVRVYAQSGDAPGPEYERAYKEWEAGGRRTPPCPPPSQRVIE